MEIVKTKEVRRGRVEALAYANPDHRVIPLVNGAAVIDVAGDTPLNLEGWDLGMGVAVLRLYRTCIQQDKMELAARFLTAPRSHANFAQLYRTMAVKLQHFHCQFTSKERKEIAKETGALNGPDSFLKISSDEKSRWPWLLISSSCPTLSQIVANGERYEQVEDQLEDLERLQEYTKLSRRLCLKRLSLLYYKTKNVEEVGCRPMDFPVHSIDAKQVCLLSNADLREWNYFRGGKFGDILYSLKPGKPPPVLPALTGFADEAAEAIGREILQEVLKNCQGVSLEPWFQFQADRS